MFHWNLDLIIREQKCIQSSLPKVQKLFLPITGYKNLHLGLKLAVALKATTLCFTSPCSQETKTDETAKNHVNWQYEESVLSYCLTGICTWAAADTSPNTLANNEFQGFVPGFIHSNLSWRGLFFSAQKSKSSSHKKVLMLLKALPSWRQARSTLLAGFWLHMHSTHWVASWEMGLFIQNWVTQRDSFNSPNWSLQWISDGWNTSCLVLCNGLMRNTHTVLSHFPMWTYDKPSRTWTCRDCWDCR